MQESIICLFLCFMLLDLRLCPKSLGLTSLVLATNADTFIFKRWLCSYYRCKGFVNIFAK